MEPERVTEMPLYSGDAAGILQLAVRSEFNAAYARRKPLSLGGTLATPVSGTSATIPFGWLGNVPRMKKKVGETQRQKLRDNKFSVTDEEYEEILAFERKLFEDQQFDAIMPRVRDLANEAVRAVNRAIIIDTFANGTAVNCYDGQPLFSANHAEGNSGTQSNLFNLVFSAANLQTVITSMGAYVDDQGEPMEIQPTHIVFGPALEFPVMQVLNSSLIVAGAGAAQGNANVLQNYLAPVKSSYLIGPYANYWYVEDASREMRAAILYERSDVPTEVSTKFDPQDDNMFYDGEAHVKVRKRFTVAPGLWQTIGGNFV